MITSAKDPRTVSGWSRLVFVSPGALRNWCRTAGVSARADRWCSGGCCAPRFSVRKGATGPRICWTWSTGGRSWDLLKFAGLDPERPFPKSPEEFLQQQMIVRDADRL